MFGMYVILLCGTLGSSLFKVFAGRKSMFNMITYHLYKDDHPALVTCLSPSAEMEMNSQ